MAHDRLRTDQCVIEAGLGLHPLIWPARRDMRIDSDRHIAQIGRLQG